MNEKDIFEEVHEKVSSLIKVSDRFREEEQK